MKKWTKATAWILSAALLFSTGGAYAQTYAAESSGTAESTQQALGEDSALSAEADETAEKDTSASGTEMSADDSNAATGGTESSPAADGATDDAAGVTDSKADDTAPLSDDNETDGAADSSEGETDDVTGVSAEELADTLLGAERDISWTEADLTVQYDDRYSLDDLDAVAQAEESDGDYVIYEIETDLNSIVSFQVSGGKKTSSLDTDVVTQESGSDTDIIAVGVGTATVYLVPESQKESGQVTSGVAVTVTVEPAVLTLMLLAGQSNMEGLCSSSTGYEPEASVACEAGTVYSTYAPTTSSYAKSITGVTFSSVATKSNAKDFVAGSLQGTASISGKTLAYSLDSLTTEGSGKTGPDSGLAYEWNQLTGEKVWVVNAAWSGSSITTWVSGGSNYERAKAVFSAAIQTYKAEIAAGHYTEGSRLIYWLQGETGDRTMTAASYESYFSSMYQSMTEDFDPTAIGIIMVRASTGSYTNSDELVMTGPRIAQYAIGASTDYGNVYVVSNVNEQWISDSGVKSYFKSAYTSGSLTYPMHTSSKSALPTTMSKIHNDIHYSQIGHNENGITAAQGMYTALVAEGKYTDASVSTKVTGLLWKNADGETLSSLTMEYRGYDEVVVPVTTPVSLAKQVSYTATGVISYDSMTCEVSASNSGTGKLTAKGGSLSTWLNVKVNRSYDLTGKAGKTYTGIYSYNGTKYYLVNGWVQATYTGTVKDSSGIWYVVDGVADTSYTGFQKYGSTWYYFESGQVTYSKNSVIKDNDSNGESTIDGNASWWYVVGSKVQTDFTGLADYSNENGWWYIENGKVTFSKNTVAKNKNGWYYVKNSKVVFSYTGFAENSNGWWYIEKGKVTFKKNSVIKGTVDGTTAWWYVTGSKVQTGFTGLANYSNSNGWWYIKNGKVDFT
ncbi:MAG: hypothetical protein LUC83_08210 [Clostridiales bacterium]|nr:hypothetical protein [Clostridiales bacterium]